MLALVNYYADGKITYIFSIKGLVLPKLRVMYYRKLETFIINKQIGEPKHRNKELFTQDLTIALKHKRTHLALVRLLAVTCS